MTDATPIKTALELARTAHVKQMTTAGISTWSYGSFDAGWHAHAAHKAEASEPARDGERLLHDKLADALAEIVRLRLRLGDDPHAPLSNAPVK